MFLELQHLRVGKGKDLSDKLLLGDPFVPLDDISDARVEIVFRRYDHHPGVRESRVAGPADHMGVDQRDPSRGKVALRAQRRPESTGAAADNKNVRIYEPTNIFKHGTLPRKRPAPHDRMNIDTLLGTKDFAVETSHAVLGILDDWNLLFLFFFHVDYIRGTNGVAKTAARTFIQVDVDDHGLAYASPSSFAAVFPKIPSLTSSLTSKRFTAPMYSRNASIPRPVSVLTPVKSWG